MKKIQPPKTFNPKIIFGRKNLGSEKNYGPTFLSPITFWSNLRLKQAELGVPHSKTKLSWPNQYFGPQ